MNVDFTKVMISIANNNANISKNDYFKDGILYCGNCNTQKQCKIISLGRQFIVPCTCKCESEEIKRKEQHETQIKRIQYIRNLKANGIQDKQIKNWTFENDNGKNSKNMDNMMRYYSKWDTMYKQNIGLLLWGNKGNGKSYCAACIANALLNNGVPVLATSFIKIINDLKGFEVRDKNSYINSFNNFKLLVIDDLGTENQTDFALEIIFSVIDSRYKNGQPLIITTNLSLQEMQNPINIKYSRIYDRILEMCTPIAFKGESMRSMEYEKKLEKAREIFND